MPTTQRRPIALHLTSLVLVAALLAGCKAERPDDQLYEREDHNTTCGPAGDGSGPTPNGCGCWRWFVKTGTDKYVGQVSPTIVDTDIATLRARGGGVPAPGLSIPTGRILTGTYQEVTTYRLKNVWLQGCKSESDADVHLILGAGANDVTNRMVAEIPSSTCVNDNGFGTPWKTQITAARATLNGATACTNPILVGGVATPLQVTVTGVGFFDDPHGQTGGSPNGIEIHPVLSICFGQDCGGGTTTGPFTIGGTVSGLSGTGLQLKNGTDTLPLAANGSFSFPTKVASGGSYAVTVIAQPTSPSQTCAVANGSGTVGADVSSVAVTCTTNSFAIKGTISGLTGSGLLLGNNAESLTVAANATAFTFPTKVLSGQPYAFSVKTQPSGPTQTCALSSGAASGTVGSADVQLALTCTTATYSIGGKVLGLSVAGLILANGAETLSINANGGLAVPFTFTTKVASGQAYAVTLSPQSTVTCSISGGSGTVVSANVTGVVVNCNTNSFTVGGTVTGLTGTVVLTNNSGDDLPVNANGQFAFPTPLTNGLPYLVAVKTQPTNPVQTCAVTNGSGAISGANVTSVAVACSTTAFSVSGTIAGLSGSGLALRNGNETITIQPGTTSFSFPTKVAGGAPYDVAVASQPTSPSQTCTVANGTGDVGAGDVTAVAVTCATNTYAIGLTIAGLEGDGLSLHLVSGGVAQDLEISGGATSAAFPIKVGSGDAYSVAVVRQPAAPDQTCTLVRANGAVAAANLDVGVSCVTSSTSTDGGSDAGQPDAGPKCGPGQHAENGKCVVDVSGGDSKAGCSSAGGSPLALGGLLGLLLWRRRRS